MTVISVNSDAVRQAAGHLFAAADLVAGAFGPRAGDLIPNSQGGWRAVAQLRQVGQAWDAYLRAAAARIDGAGQDLLALADSMQRANDEAGRPWGGGFVP